MRALLIASVLIVGLVEGTLAQSVTTGGGPLETGAPRDNASEETSAMFPAAQASAIRLGRTLGNRQQAPMFERDEARPLGSLTGLIKDIAGQTNLLAIADDHLIVPSVAVAEPREQRAWGAEQSPDAGTNAEQVPAHARKPDMGARTQ